jgi:hypothetical protein
MHFQQDGAPPHRRRDVTNWLNNHLGNRWTGWHGPVHWPPRSPDLSILDFFVWGFIHDKVYGQQVQPADVDELRARITDAAAQISQQMLQKAFTEYEARLTMTLLVNGGKFEHLLN